MPEAKQETVHATCVATDTGGVLILGASGSGKSGLGLALMALGARLVADDRTVLERRGDDVIASAPETIRGLIEARGIGILHAPVAAEARIALAVDLDRVEAHRLPPVRTITLMGQSVPLLHKVDNVHFAAAILHYLAWGRREE
ncbi:HPr kinase/phosphorylase [Chachezhania antarctica]|uniref:HPr kinase/phosphorylase n=1 Tax=Chachezhania antarctica TaxID=2340860 RepID=UPI000EB492CC|nr:HPr kinase/phosphatase C-terminal domain-containing protein [Chachezhania antarctica]|tara:strand:+ start:1998 stop:2429 length:432 start_codon:yes stop_codon:yes gene_type:complete